MCCYLFTYHAYGSWMPDHPRGYVRRNKGVSAPDQAMAVRYRANQAQEVVDFDETIQKLLVDEVVVACEFQQLRGHSIATKSTHVHILVSWKSGRACEVVQAKLRESMTRRLNREVEKRDWFSKSPSRKMVTDDEHFAYLVTTYLPKHSGWKWCEGRGVFR